MDQILKELERKISSVVSAFIQEVAGLRSNRPTPALVEDVKIEYFGQQVPVKQLGNVSVLPPREMVINLWDPTPVKEVAKALEDAKRGFSVSLQGSAIRINLPPLSQERREEMTKLLKQIAETAKIKIRSCRDDANKAVEAGLKAKTITEDQKTRGRKKIQEVVDKANQDVEAQVAKKSQEFLE